jgi:hypothetical protein
MLLVVVAMLLGAMPLALTGALVYAMARLMRHENLPSWLGLANAYVRLGQAYVELAMASLVRPLLRAGAARASLRGWGAAALNMLKGSRR